MAYAWSPIRYGGETGDPQNPSAPTTFEMVNVGDEVDAGKLGISDEEFEALVESGAVRDIPYPEDVPQGKSVSQHLRDVALAADEAVDTTGGTYLLDEPERMAVARATQMEVDERGETEDEEVSEEDARQAKTPVTEGKDLSLPKAENGNGEQAASTTQTTSSPQQAATGTTS
jgi:hypothetical protein